jgi:hypothetical protein
VEALEYWWFPRQFLVLLALQLLSVMQRQQTAWFIVLELMTIGT